MDFRKKAFCLDFRPEYCIFIYNSNDAMRQFSIMITPSLQQERSRILEQMAQMDRMIRGHVSQQTFQVQRGGQTLTQGPYFLLQRRENGKNNCQRVGTEELEAIVAGVEAYQRFQKLAERYARLTEQMTWEQQAAGVKKKFQRFWRPSFRKPRSA